MENKKYQKQFDALWKAMEKESTGPITSPESSLVALSSIRKKQVEHFNVILLDGGSRIIKTVNISKGTINQTLVHPREVFREAIKRNAASIIVGHNHPSGALEPSLEDDRITKRLAEAGKIIGIQVLDHIIVSRFGFYSYMEHKPSSMVPTDKI